MTLEADYALLTLVCEGVLPRSEVVWHRAEEM